MQPTPRRLRLQWDERSILTLTSALCPPSSPYPTNDPDPQAGHTTDMAQDRSYYTATNPALVECHNEKQRCAMPSGHIVGSGTAVSRSHSKLHHVHHRHAPARPETYTLYRESSLRKATQPNKSGCFSGNFIRLHGSTPRSRAKLWVNQGTGIVAPLLSQNVAAPILGPNGTNTVRNSWCFLDMASVGNGGGDGGRGCFHVQCAPRCHAQVKHIGERCELWLPDELW